MPCVSDATPQIVAEQFDALEPLDELAAGSVVAFDAEQTLYTQAPEVTRAA